MKKLLSLLIAILLLFDVTAQNIELSFTGVVDQSYITLDSIKIMNRTKDCDTLLVNPDTVLSLTVVGFNHYQSEINALSLSQNFPNPFANQTSFSVSLPDKDYLHLMVHNLIGQKIAEDHAALDAGEHHFTFYPSQDNWYVLTATTPNGSQSIKMSCLGSGSPKGKLIKKRNLDGGIHNLGYKDAAKDDYFSFEIGDTLLYVGYVNTFTGVLESGILDSPEQSESLTFQYATNIPCPGMPTVDYEGQTYNTIQIFSQCWLKENLNVGTMIQGNEDMEDNGIIEKYCYDNVEDSCAKYGGLYQWDEMMQYVVQQGTQGICPAGWHIPTDEEWKVLEGAVDSQYGIGNDQWEYWGDRGCDAGTNLKTTGGWYANGNGTDLYGFSGLPGGYRYYFDGYSYDVGDRGHWWLSTSDDYSALYRTLIHTNPQVISYGGLKVYGFSVRCIKD